MPLRVVVIGGLGNFGARIVRRLKLEPGIELTATARRPVPTVGGKAPFAIAALDTERPHWEADLAALSPGLVIHCAGPFQGQDYRVALAALGCGAHYVDLADGRAFVQGFVSAVDPAARRGAGRDLRREHAAGAVDRRHRLLLEFLQRSRNRRGPHRAGPACAAWSRDRRRGLGLCGPAVCLARAGRLAHRVRLAGT